MAPSRDHKTEDLTADQLEAFCQRLSDTIGALRGIKAQMVDLNVERIRVKPAGGKERCFVGLESFYGAARTALDAARKERGDFGAAAAAPAKEAATRKRKQ